MKKLFYWLITSIQFILLVSAYAVQYFSMRKMGMMRYLVYKNQLWQSQYPITLFRYAAVTILIILALICIMLYYKKMRTTGKRMLLDVSASVVLTIIFVFFTLASSPSGYRAYYLICILLALAALIQDMKSIICLTAKKV